MQSFLPYHFVRPGALQKFGRLGGRPSALRDQLIFLACMVEFNDAESTHKQHFLILTALTALSTALPQKYLQHIRFWKLSRFRPDQPASV